MESKVLSNIGIDPIYLIILLFLIQIFLFILLINANLKYNRLKISYLSFMKGKDGKNLEESFAKKFKELENLIEVIKKHDLDIIELYKKVDKGYQKMGLVRYNAFHETEDNLSFVLTVLNEFNNGWIMNVMHSQEGCYTYVKEIIKGQSYIELSEEERESLEHAIYQETYDIKDADIGLE